MTYPDVALRTELPKGDSWDFGDFPYALEPLWLPDAHAFGDGDSVPDGRGRFEATCLRLLEIASGDGPPVDVEDADSAERLFWFRWITGHQLTFILWQLTARAAHEVSDAVGEADQAAGLRRLTQYVRGYSAMLLYTSSVPRDVYHDVIRPSMFLQHRGFSGGWAPDHDPIRDLLRGRRLPCADHPESVELRRAVKTVQLIHFGIAAKLVPNGRSLLRQSVSTTSLRDPSVLGVLYDNYFIVLREPTSTPDVVAQLLRRLNAVALDVSANGLYPGGAERGPEELDTDEVLEYERDFLRIITEAGSLAAGFPAAAVTGRRSLDG
jgi:hypothetical protein